MTRFILACTPEQKAALEDIRKSRGLRSLAEAVRVLIDEAAFERGPPLNVPIAPRAEVERLMEGAHPVQRVKEQPNRIVRGLTEAVQDDIGATKTLQIGPVERKPGSLAKKR